MLESENEVLMRTITGWAGHGWKDGMYVDDLEDYFTEVKDKIEVILAGKQEGGVTT